MGFLKRASPAVVVAALVLLGPGTGVPIVVRCTAWAAAGGILTFCPAGLRLPIGRTRYGAHSWRLSAGSSSGLSVFSGWYACGLRVPRGKSA